jgi:hypothetical protein
MHFNAVPKGSIIIRSATTDDLAGNLRRRILFRGSNGRLYWLHNDGIEESIAGAACPTCLKMFKTIPDQQKHSSYTHNRNRHLAARDRPVNRGAYPCGIDACGHTFSNPDAASQHRRDKHGIEEAIVGKPDIGQTAES